MAVTYCKPKKERGRNGHWPLVLEFDRSGDSVWTKYVSFYKQSLDWDHINQAF